MPLFFIGIVLGVAIGSYVTKFVIRAQVSMKLISKARKDAKFLTD